MSVRQENRWRRTLKESNDRASDIQRQIEAAFMERKERKESVKPEPFASRRQVRSWMRRNAEGFESATELAEATRSAADRSRGSPGVRVMAVLLASGALPAA